MKQLKSILSALCLTMLLFTFTSCGSDDDEPKADSNSIVGHWGMIYTYPAKAGIGYTFNANGTGFMESYVTEYELGEDNPHYYEKENFTYKAKDGILTATTSDGETDSAPYKIKDGKLYLTITVSDEDEEDVETETMILDRMDKTIADYFGL